jgi:hypothetical protein
MSNHPAPIVADILAELRTQLDAHGEISGARIARLKFPDVPSSSWGRYLKQARAEWNEALRLREAGLPASSIPPATTAPTGTAPANQVDASAPSGTVNWIAQIGAMLKQCDLLARQSIFIDPATGVERIRNPIVLQQSIRARAAALKLAADREAVMYGAERVLFWERELGREIGRAIGRVRNDDQRVIADRVMIAIESVSRRRVAEREYLGGDMKPKPADESTKDGNA